MDTAPQNVPPWVDLRDDYRDGFIDALFYQQGIARPTLSQMGQAIAVLIGYRAHHDFLRQELTDTRLEQLAAMKNLQVELKLSQARRCSGSD